LLGWGCEGNIYWNTKLFTLVESGLEDVHQRKGIEASKHRRLFWAKLKFNATGQIIVASTAHLTYQVSK
jgi:hypothetical protein